MRRMSPRHRTVVGAKAFAGSGSSIVDEGRGASRLGRLFRLGFGAAFALALAAGGPGAERAAASPSAPITLYVGYGPGGGFDLYARLFAKYYGAHLPGSPNVIVQNVVGAGSLTLANNLYNLYPKDGTALGVVAQTLPLDQVLGKPGISFDFSKFQMIGRLGNSNSALVAWRTSPVQSVAQAQKLSVPVSATGPSSDAFLLPTVLNNVLGTKFKVVVGYSGTSETMLALQRGEADVTAAITSSLQTQFANYMKNGDIHPFVLDAFRRSSLYPGVPTTIELARTPRERKILELFAIGAEVGRSIIAPPGVPEDRLNILRRAFDLTIKDPEFIAAAKRAKMDMDPLSGAELQKVIGSMDGLDASLVKDVLAAETARR